MPIQGRVCGQYPPDSSLSIALEWRSASVMTVSKVFVENSVILFNSWWGFKLMKVTRLLHGFMALLILLQSVSSLALPQDMASQSHSSATVLQSQDQTTAAVPVQPDIPPCHGVVNDPPTQDVNDCCDSMDGQCCPLGCAVISPAIPGSVLLPGSATAAKPAVQASVVQRHKIPSRLFRPPRTSC